MIQSSTIAKSSPAIRGDFALASGAHSPGGPRRSRTRAAPPKRPPGLPFGHPRYRKWLIYGATSVFFFLMAAEFLALWWRLIEGEASWQGARQTLGHPLALVYHLGLLGMVSWFGGRTYFKLFARTQPPRIGPIRRPPLWVFPPVLGFLWLCVTAITTLYLWGYEA
jgi:hypothetical protein